MKHLIPPAIRVFISSTFSDMENERRYFNTVLEPELSRLCALRGVSFFAVDLRWGITEEQANNGEVIPICLREIDNCRPFFIGIIGNRYGSTLAEIGFTDDGQFPWLKGRENKSATELEMLYGVLECEEGREAPDCIFILRSDRLSAENFRGTESEEKQRCVNELRKRVSESGEFPCEDYDSLEEFGEKLIRQFTVWLDKNFPSAKSAAQARHDFYNGELMRNYVEIKETEEFISRFCRFGGAPLLISGSGPRGKTSLLTHWEPEEGRKVLINVESDPAYAYWPTIGAELLELLTSEKQNLPEFCETEEELDDFRRYFLEKLGSIQTDTPVYIVINDIDKLKGAKAEYLSWLPSFLPDDLYIICSAGDPGIAATAELLDWIVQELPMFSKEQEGEFLTGCLELHGKSLSPAQESSIRKSGAVSHAGYIKRVVRFLNRYASFESLDGIADEIGKCETDTGLHAYIWKYVCSGLSSTAVKAAETAAYLLSSCSLAPSEEELFGLVNGLVKTSRMEWIPVGILLDLFDVKKSDTWRISDSSVRDFFACMPADVQKAETILSDHYYDLLLDSYRISPLWDQNTGKQDPESKRKSILFAKAAVTHMLKAKNYARTVKLLEDTLVEECLLEPETDFVRSAWMQILINSDEDVESRLRNRKDQTHVSLLLDMGFENAAAEEAEQLPDVELLSEMQFKYIGNVRREIYEYYDQLSQLFDSGRYSTVLDMVGNLIPKIGDRLNPYEGFLLLYMAAESLAHLSKYEACLDMSQKAYREAVRSMNDYDVMRTLKMRGFCYMCLDRTVQAEELFRFVMQRAAALGDTADYLDALSKYSGCELQRGNADISVPKLCEKIWSKLGSIRDVADSIMAAVSVLKDRGDLEEACDETERAVRYLSEHSAELPDGNDQLVHILMFLGQLKEQMGKEQEAEKYYLFARNMVAQTPAEQMLPEIYSCLLRIYKDNHMYTRSAQIHDEFAELLYKYDDIDGAIEEIKKAHAAYLEAGLTDECDAFDRKWEARKEEDVLLDFDLRNMYSNGVNEAAPDIRVSSRDAAEWEKKLLLARSGGNAFEIAETLLEGASMFKYNEPTRARKLLMETIEVLHDSGDDATAGYARMSNADLFLRLSPDDPERKAYFDGYSDEDLALFDIWGKMLRCEYDDEEYASLLARITDCEKLDGVRLFCVLSEADTILQYHNGSAPDILRKMSDAPEHEFFIQKAEIIYSSLMESQFGNMRNDPLNPNVTERLEYYKKAVELLQIAGSTKVAFIAGDMAPILRRRGEYELALKYHDIAAKSYLDAADLQEYFTEQINLALTYKEMGDYGNSAEILMNILAGENLPIDDYPQQKAAASGNLAGLILSQLDDGEILEPEMEELLLECFNEEESFYRSVDEPYDLAVSLVNQLQYLYRDPETHREAILKKYVEAKDIAKEYSIGNILEFLAQYRRVVIDDLIR